MHAAHFVFVFASVVGLAVGTGCTRVGADGRSPETRDGSRVFPVTGVVRAPLQDGSVLIEHEEIRGFMPAMTMPFFVANTTEAARLAVGDRVRFQFVVGETASHAKDFEIIGRENPPVRQGGITSAIEERPAPPRRLKAGDRVPPFTLVDQEGRSFTQAELEGRLTVVTFIFTRCPVPEFCPAMAQRFSALQDDVLADAHLHERTQLVSLTLDPEFDRPEILRAYGEAVGANFGIWKFATGQTTEIEKLARAFAVFSERKNGTLDHTLCTALIGTDGRVIETWRGNGWAATEVLDAVRAAL